VHHLYLLSSDYHVYQNASTNITPTQVLDQESWTVSWKNTTAHTSPLYSLAPLDQAGLPIKNPPKKPTQKTHPKNPPKNTQKTPLGMGFFGFVFNFNFFYENNTNFSL
jgi:hypothetical protein